MRPSKFGYRNPYRRHSSTQSYRAGSWVLRSRRPTRLHCGAHRYKSRLHMRRNDNESCYNLDRNCSDWRSSSGLPCRLHRSRRPIRVRFLRRPSSSAPRTYPPGKRPRRSPPASSTPARCRTAHRSHHNRSHSRRYPAADSRRAVESTTRPRRDSRERSTRTNLQSTPRAARKRCRANSALAKRTNP